MQERRKEKTPEWTEMDKKGNGRCVFPQTPELKGKVAKKPSAEPFKQEREKFSITGWKEV